MKILNIILFALLFSFQTFAANVASQVSYDGRLYASDGVTPINVLTTFQIEVLDQTQAKILYIETQNMPAGTNGYFSFKVGTGTVVNAYGNTFDSIFVNGTLINSSAGALTPAAGDVRYLRVTAGGQLLSPNITVGSVPSAFSAEKAYLADSANKISGYSVYNAAPANGQVLTWVSANSRWEATTPSAGSVTLTGDVTGSGTGSFATTLANTAVTAGAYGSVTQIPVITVDAKGRLTAASSVTLNTTNIVEGSNLYYTNARAISATLTAYSAGAGTVTAADTVLSALQKIDGNVAAKQTALGFTPINKAGDTGIGALTLTGVLTTDNTTVPTGKKVTLVDAPVAGTDAANKNYVTTTLAGYLPLTGGTLTANTTANSNITFASSSSSAIFKDNGVNFVSLHAPTTVTTSYILTLPPADGTSGQVLSTNGAGTLSWTSAGGGEPVITAGTAAQYWRGDKTWQNLNTSNVPEGANLYYTNARGIASTLTGYSAGAGTVVNTDSVLQALQKIDGNDQQKVLKIGDTMTGPLVNNTNSASTAVAVTQAGAGFAATFMGGKVGIGTVSPAGVLHVATSGGTPTIRSDVNDSTVGSLGTPNLYLRNINNTSNNSNTITNINWNGYQDSAIQFVHENHTATPLSHISFWASNSAAPTNVMQINGNGNVGIGTANPVATIDVNGFMKLKKNNAAPTACNVSLDGAMAMAMGYSMCVCMYDNISTSWQWMDSSGSGNGGLSQCNWGCVHGSQTFTNTAVGSNYNFTGHGTCTNIKIQAWGAGGGGSNSNTGGGGGYAFAQHTLGAQNTPLSIVIGSAGQYGGAAGLNAGVGSGNTGGGGGLAAVSTGVAYAPGAAIVIAGGGGGAGTDGSGGGGGGMTGMSGMGMGSGMGGNNVSGGGGGTGANSGAYGSGGNSDIAGGGGGGAGYYGGGGGGNMTAMHGGGGGGSGYIIPAASMTNLMSAAGQNPYSPVPVGCGGNTATGGNSFSSGTPGCVVISW